MIIERVTPAVDCGRFPAKSILGEPVHVEATVFRDGHSIIRAVVVWGLADTKRFEEAPMSVCNPGLDRFSGEFTPPTMGRYRFTVEAWTDPYASWLVDFEKRVRAKDPDARSELLVGVSMLEKAADIKARTRVRDALAALRNPGGEIGAALQVVADSSLVHDMTELLGRADVVRYAPGLELVVERERARTGAWYELFVRSQTTDSHRSGTFRDAERRLPELSAMGFDVVYLAPIHPIGHTARKGRNNCPTAQPGDPGSPWAIGSEHGGHTAIEPSLGSIEDFDRFLRVAGDHQLEIALDFAVQCSPDHPWVKEHPGWFSHRADGTIRYAENPPKKYQDIFPLNFDCEDWQGLWNALREVVLFWIGHGVKIFRVDNPHTKPLEFWAWLIEQIRREHPDVIFLAEAFTRPPMMYALAKIGFSQSYSYFTWKNSRYDLTSYLEELTLSEVAEYYRPNFFANTPDILHAYLQAGGRPAFCVRLLLAATLAPSYGIYSGYELCENEAVSGSEEYLNSEKYEIRVRDWNAPGNLRKLITKINQIRRENPALSTFRNLRFFPSDNEHVIFFGKATSDGTNRIFCVVNLDPVHPQQATVTVPVSELSLPSRYRVVDLLTGERYEWGGQNFVQLDPRDPARVAAHVLRVEAIE